jgi:ubiquinone/menaquinone biosynthesis C-methylase UbiE
MKMDHFEAIYSQRAADYHQMIVCEDVDGNLPKTLQEILPVRCERILDLGTGTGRLPLLLSKLHTQPTIQWVGMDIQSAMLHENLFQRALSEGEWDLVNGDIRRLPFPNNKTDATIAAWVISHFRSWLADDWQNQIGLVLKEMQRVTRPEGSLIIIETLGTGSLEPGAPLHSLEEYYEWLRHIWRFDRIVIQTDYLFNSVTEAVEKTEFFFGPGLSAKIRANNWKRLPEWTGIWYRAN